MQKTRIRVSGNDTIDDAIEELLQLNPSEVGRIEISAFSSEEENRAEEGSELDEAIQAIIEGDEADEDTEVEEEEAEVEEAEEAQEAQEEEEAEEAEEAEASDVAEIYDDVGRHVRTIHDFLTKAAENETISVPVAGYLYEDEILSDLEVVGVLSQVGSEGEDPVYEISDFGSRVYSRLQNMDLEGAYSIPAGFSEVQSVLQEIHDEKGPITEPQLDKRMLESATMADFWRAGLVERRDGENPETGHKAYVYRLNEFGRTLVD